MTTSPPESSAPEFVSQQVKAARRFYLNLKPRPRTSLAVVCGGWEECAPDYAIDRATFPYWSVEFVATGQGQLSLGAKPYDLVPGTVFVYGPGISQRILTSREKPMVKYFVDFSGTHARALMSEYGLLPGICVRLTAHAEVRQAFDSLIRLAGRLDRHTSRGAVLELELLLMRIERATQPATPTARRALATFERCRQHVDIHYRELRTIEQAAKACHVDVSHLCRLFRRFLGESPFRYLQRRQMQWAADRLSSSDRLVREVADELGIDPFQFSRMFKRIHGLSPSAFLGTR